MQALGAYVFVRFASGMHTHYYRGTMSESEILGSELASLIRDAHAQGELTTIFKELSGEFASPAVCRI